MKFIAGHGVMLKADNEVSTVFCLKTGRGAKKMMKNDLKMKKCLDLNQLFDTLKKSPDKPRR